MNFLSLESATNSPSVAIFINNQLIDVNKSVESNSSVLASMVDETLSRNKISPSQLDFISVTIGPGTYTGLRVGLSLAQGISYSIDCPIVPVNILDVILWKADNSKIISVAYYSHADFFYYKSSGKNKETKLVSIKDLKGQTLHGCNLEEHANVIKYKKINFTAVDVGNFALNNYDLLKENDIGSISPIYLNDYLKLMEK